MKENIKQLNKKNIQSRHIIKRGESIYNSLRNSDIRLYTEGFDGKLNLHDKQCLSLYLSVIQGNNFFTELLKKLNYERFTNFSSNDTNDYHYEDEFWEFANTFDIDNYLEVLILYLLECPIIKQLILKEGYSLWKIKLAVYDYVGNEIRNMNGNFEKNSQKVLTI